MRTGYMFFAVGLIYGFGLGVLLDQTNAVNLTSLSLLIGALFLVPAIGWLESRTHLRRLASWGRIREQGKFTFIGIWYILLRGGIFSAILMISLRGISRAWPVDEITVPVILVALFIIGLEEWKECEHQFRFESQHSTVPTMEPSKNDESVDME